MKQTLVAIGKCIINLITRFIVGPDKLLLKNIECLISKTGKTEVAIKGFGFVDTSKENLLKTETIIRFVGGKAKGETEVLFTGLWDEVYRGYFIRQSPKDIEDYINRMVKKWSSTAEVDTFQLLPKDLVNQMGQHLQLVLRFTWEEPLIGNGKYAMLPLHYLSTDFGLMRYILGEMALRRRNFNFRTRFTISSEDRVRMEFDEDYKEIILPKNEPVEKVGYSLRFDFQKPSRRAVEIRRSFALNRVEFTPAEYLQLKGCTEQQEIADKKVIMLKRRGVPKGSSNNVEGCLHGVCPVGGELNSLRSLHRGFRSAVTLERGLPPLS